VSDIFHAHGPLVEVGVAWLERLKAAAAASPRRRARLCLHQAPADRVQEMVIALGRDTQIRPHRHPGRSESIHVLEGAALVVLFDDLGAELRRLGLGLGPEEARLYRLSSNTWHTLLPLSELVVVHEVVEGPFDGGGQEFAAWAPAAEGPELAAWLQRVRTGSQRPLDP